MLNLLRCFITLTEKKRQTRPTDNIDRNIARLHFPYLINKGIYLIHAGCGSLNQELLEHEVYTHFRQVGQFFITELHTLNGCTISGYSPAPSTSLFTIRYRGQINRKMVIALVDRSNKFTPTFFLKQMIDQEFIGHRPRSVIGICNDELLSPRLNTKTPSCPTIRLMTMQICRRSAFRTSCFGAARRSID